MGLCDFPVTADRYDSPVTRCVHAVPELAARRLLIWVFRVARSDLGDFASACASMRQKKGVIKRTRSLSLELNGRSLYALTVRSRPRNTIKGRPARA